MIQLLAQPRSPWLIMEKGSIMVLPTQPSNTSLHLQVILSMILQDLRATHHRSWLGDFYLLIWIMAADALSFLDLDMGYFVLLPLFYSTSIPLGSLGLDLFIIGITFGTFGCINAVNQAKLLDGFAIVCLMIQMSFHMYTGLAACT